MALITIDEAVGVRRQGFVFPGPYVIESIREFSGHHRAGRFPVRPTQMNPVDLSKSKLASGCSMIACYMWIGECGPNLWKDRLEDVYRDGSRRSYDEPHRVFDGREHPIPDLVRATPKCARFWMI